MIGQVLSFGATAAHHVTSNYILPGFLQAGLFLAKGVPCVILSGATWAATSTAGNISVGLLAATGVGYMYKNSANPSEEYKKAHENDSLLSKLFASNEARALLGLLGSFQFYNAALAKGLYEFVDSVFLYVPSKLASLGGSGISYLYELGMEKYVFYASNPLKMYDLGAWAIAKGFIMLANNTHNRTLTRHQAMQNYAEIYGYANISFKTAEAIKDRLSWIEQYNLGNASYPENYSLQTLAGEAYTDLSTAVTNFRQDRTFNNFKAILSIIPKHKTLLAALGLAGLGALGSGGIGNAFSMIMGLSSINQLSGLMWSGPSIVGVLHKPLLYIVNYIPFTQPLLHYALVITSETTLAYGSIALSAASGIISFITIGRYVVDRLIVDTKEYDKALNREQSLMVSFNSKLTKVVGQQDGKDVMLGQVMTPEVRSIALEFLKFKEKDRSDYICAFAIKLLCCTNPNPNLILEVMKAVMTAQALGDNLPDFITNDRALTTHLTWILDVLQNKAQRVNLDPNLPAPQGIFSPNARDTANIAQNINQNEEVYLKRLDTILDENNQPGKSSGPVQELLQKLNKKAELEKPQGGFGLG